MSIDKQPKELQSQNKALGKGLKSLVLWDLHHAQQRAHHIEAENQVCCVCP